MSTAKAVIYVTEFSNIPILRPMIHNMYEDFVIDSSELKRKYASRYWELPENLDHLHPDVHKEIAPLKNESHIYKLNEPKFVFKQPFVAEIPDVTVFGDYAGAITKDGRYILDTVNSTTNTQHMRLGTIIKKDIIDSPARIGRALFGGQQPEASDRQPVAALLHNYWNENYYHWTVEELLKLRGISYYEDMTGNSVTIIIPDNPPRFVIESLGLLGYQQNDYVQWGNEPLHVDRLVVPSFPEPTPKTLDWLRRKITNQINVNRNDFKPKWVYISRQGVEERSVQNYTEVKSVLDDYNINVIKCEDLSLKEEVRIFSNVEGIIGPHGAGLTAAMWASDIHIIELFNNTIQSPYYILAHALGHDYTALAGDSIGTANKPRHKNIHIDTNKLEKVLNEVI